MNYWLIKFSPKRTSWVDILVKGKFTMRGVRNYQARNYLKEMALSNIVLYYHSQYELQVMGQMEVIRTAYQDISSSDPKWISVDFKPVKTLENPVTLKKIKATRELQNIAIIKQPRLSVMPITEYEFDTLLHLSTV
ncbi:MAG: EVE domain-containing protein [Deltaproteobacteria bacterium]|nr:EVE domain-containing protein [Deltaproteobacteria bacterium]